MIRKMLTVLAIVGSGSIAALPAQSSFGLVGGLVSASATINPPEEALQTKSRIGVAFGVSMAMPIATNLQFAPELMYVSKGIKGTAEFGSLSATITDKVNYIEAPILFRYMVGQSSNAQFSLMAGPTFAVRVSCKIEQTGIPDLPESQDCDDPYDPTTGPKKTDIGFMFGAGVHVKRLSFSVRYEAGLTNISKDDTEDASTAKNKAIFFLVGYSFGKY